MIQWIYANIGTIIISAILLLLIVMIIRKLITDKKKGKSSCGGSCGHCPMGGTCHSDH